MYDQSYLEDQVDDEKIVFSRAKAYPIVLQPRPMDVVVFRLRGAACENHMGVYTGSGRFIHCTRNVGVNIASLWDERWSRRFVYAVRVTGE